MALSVPPPSRVAIGSVLIQGQRVEVFLDPEWARYFNSLNSQVTGIAGAVGLPGAPGTTGAAGVGVSLSDEVGSSTEFIPGPRGPEGPKGDCGPVIFLMQEPEDNDVFWPIRNS